MFFTILAALSLSQTASANSQASVPPHRWTVDYSQAACTLARRIDGERSPIVILHAPLGMEPGQLLIMDGGTGLDPRLRGVLEVSIDQASPLAVRATSEERSGHAVIRLAPVPADFVDRIAHARQLAIGKDGQTILGLSFDDARQAVEALNQCNDDLLASWGVDLAARRALSRPARMTSFDWTFEVATPGDAYVAFVANVSEGGRPVDCRVVVSSGSRRVDQAVCRMFRARARLEPALDAQGEAIAAQYVTGIRWWIYGGLSPFAR